MPTTRSLVTGATGYVGGRLVPQLLEAGHTVRVLVRDERKASTHAWAGDVEIAVGDATDGEDVRAALQDVDVLYYLLHSIGTGGDFGRTEKDMAQRFADEAKREGVSRIVYLGGMIPEGEELSEHLSSRGEVGDVLLASGVPTTVLQAGVVIGSGSASFEMLRYLTERLPVMVTPTWVGTRIQPIAIRDVLRYLVGSADMPSDVSRRFDIGGPEVLTYLELMQRFAAISGLPRRRILKVPLLTPSLSSHWIGLVTPVPASLARPLVESLRNTVVAADNDISQYVPEPPDGLIDFDRSVELALTKVQDLDLPTSWSSAATADAPAEGMATDPHWAGGSLYEDVRTHEVDASPAQLWRVVEGVAGRRRWGRWRAEETDAHSFLRLRAEMRLPGLAWLELGVTPSTGSGGEEGEGGTMLRQRALFHPKGLLGHVAWWAVWPIRGIVLGGMHRTMARAAEALER